ncbi:DMT family transporter [Paenibacillus sp. ISL-20]|uniref:DMT family transporter n=1 Tax=Paenibacillus sp. ISL-20 TaxID=2819163 RepID=UPI001BE5C67E|nr:DMT family transporter [Paenibacillus sp. ISL-20]MBT2765310.1 DMT family transporter [Paenibacillus sp. ISL-20]
MARSLYIALILLSLIWGGSFFFIKNLLHDFGPWGIAFLRSTFGFLFITIIMLIMRKPFALREIRWLPTVVIAMINMALPWTLIGFSETRLASSMASVLNATTPIWTMLVGLVFFGSVFRRIQWMGMGVALVGLIILLGIRPGSFITVDFIGFAAMIGATLCYAVGSQLSKRLLGGLSMYQLTFGTLLGAMVGSGIIAFTTEKIDLSKIAEPTNIGSLVGLGIFGSGVAYILFNYMVLKGSPEFATSVTYLVPATAMIWGYTLLDEPIGWSLIIGLILILSGVFITNRGGRTRNERVAAVPK